MNYMEIPRLRQLASVRNAIELWSQPDIKNEIIHFVNSTMWEDLKECCKWAEIESHVLRKVLQLGLPLVLQKDITVIIKPIGLQIIKLFMQLEGNITPSTKYKHWISDLLNNLSWTSEGLIDKRKMAKVLTEIKKIDIKDRFALAYSFCCGKELPILWKILPHDFKAAFTNCQLDLIANDEDRLLVFWTNYCNGKMSRLKKALKQLDFDCSLFSYVFQGALRDGNDVAVKYFWNKLSDLEKDENIVGWTVLALKGSDITNDDHFNDCDKYCTDIVCFLISQMNKEQQTEIFKHHSYRLLECLLYDWPWREFFLLTAEETCKYLSEEEYLNILTRLAKRGEQTLLSILWQQRKSSYKKDFEENSILLINVFQLMDIEMIRLILNKETENLRDKIFNSESGLQIYGNLMHSDKYELFEILTHECDLVADDNILLDFKRKLAYHDLDVWFDLISLRKWDLLEKYLYWCLSSDKEIRSFKKEFLYCQCSEFVSFLIRFDKWDIVEHFLDWCLLSEEEIRNLKQKISQGEMFCEKLLYELICESKFDTVKKVFSWCFLSEDEIKEFIRECLREKPGKKLCFELLKENKLEKVDAFLECIMSAEEIAIFKRELMISPESFLIFLLISEGIFTGCDIESFFADNYSSTDKKLDMMKRVINWFHPNEEITIIFREMFQPSFQLLDGYCEILLNLLDDFISKQR